MNFWSITCLPWVEINIDFEAADVGWVAVEGRAKVYTLSATGKRIIDKLEDILWHSPEG